MKPTWNRAAALLAAIIGAMAAVAGGQVLLGKDPGYFVISWVPLYNYSMGILTLLVSSVLIWRSTRLALPIAVATLSLHSLVMLILQTAYGQVVAAESTQAMTVRITAWVVITVLAIIGRRAGRTTPVSAFRSVEG